MSTPDPSPQSASGAPHASASGQAVTQAPRGSGHVGLALTALILAAIAAVGSLVTSLVTLMIMYASRPAFAATGAMGGASTILFGLVAIAALTLGIIAARGSRPVMAGIAIGIAAAQLVAALYGLVAPLISLIMAG